MLLKILILLLSLISIAHARFNPQIIEVGRSTLEDVKNSYKILSVEVSQEGAKVYNLDITNLQSQGLRSISVICDANYIVQSILLIIDKSQFQDLYESLRAQYTLLSDDTTDTLGRLVLFANHNVHITLDDSIDSVYLTYINSNMVRNVAKDISQ